MPRPDGRGRGVGPQATAGRHERRGTACVTLTAYLEGRRKLRIAEVARPPRRYAVADSRDGRTVLADQGRPALGPRENVIDLPEGPRDRAC